ncbi:LysR family transcriptional regulator [Azohydromonas australica]|uniref:LysR family transcriptional regulator n=1 Tax=Azohydromonas australica TaxID=364039 RepID=UPI000407413A|nr:LysR family transcriptional regulator [Azohydromonas australica]
MVTHKQLRYFVEIVEAGSFSLAAQRLYVAQSALSRQVREMEDTLQVVLLERDARHLALTAAGRSLYEDARRLLALLQDAVARAGHAQRGTEGTLKLLHSSSVPLDPCVLALLQRHVQDCPGVSIEVSQGSSEQQALEIDEGRADVGLVRAPLLRRLARLQYTPLYAERLWAALPAAHALAGRESVGLGELREDRFVAVPHPERGGLSHRVAELCRVEGFQPRPAAVRSRKWSQLSLVQAGFGVAVVPASMAQLAPAGVRTVPLRGEGCTTQVMALWRHDAPALVLRFAQALQAALAPG